ncbi:hypothetical protein F4779DRAFT_637795 [Xylariaceae sp. FL0662B]|nr:hypothetical protein F4779DRAFT_637795 [Xylariaceae sp. FL0662B]
MHSGSPLPREIQRQKLKFLLNDGCSVAQLAAVSRQWQAVIKRHNFERINITLWRIPDLGPMTRRNRALLKYIWLALELDEYDCSRCGGENQDIRHVFCRAANNCVVITTMHDLFLTLSAWGPQGDLTLDISIHSPSDSQHWFKYLTFGPDALPHSRVTLGQRDDPEHAWIAGKPFSAPPEAALCNVFEEVLGKPYGLFFNKEEESKWWQTLPEVPAITSVLLRLQNRRRWRPFTLTQMLSRLPGLKEFHYEPWRAWSTGDQRAIDQAYCSLFDSIAPRKLRKLILFENFDEQYPSCFAHCDDMRAPALSVGQAVARASLELEHLSASFIVDAGHFLCAVKPGWNWPHLTSLTLTSQLLSAEEDVIKINDMLEAAASTALKIRKLKTMEIWNGRVGSAALFRYRLEGSRCAKAVAHAHDSGNYFVVREYLDETISINSHADAIKYLEVSKVLRPVSLQQIQTTHKMRLEGYWAKALRYYSRVEEQYDEYPSYAEYMEHEGIVLLRERGLIT